MPRKTFELELKSSTEIAPGVRHFRFDNAEGENLKFRAGQFFTLHLEREGEEVLRSYSVAAPCTEDPSVEFSVAFVEGGIGTGTLFGLEEGGKVLPGDAGGDWRFARYLVLSDEGGVWVAPRARLCPVLWTARCELHVPMIRTRPVAGICCPWG